MAVVRFSDELKNAITDNAKALFSKRIQDAFKATPPIADELADLVFASYMPAISALPRDFFRWTNRVEIRVPYNVTHIEATYETKREYPKHDSRLKIDGVTVDSMYGINIKLPADNPKYQPYVEQIIAWSENIKAIEKQRDEFVSGVKAVVEAHSTLAPALKAWPPLWDLVPETFRERHRKVVERAKPAAAAELDVDLTSLTAAVTIAKITR
jgi:hypothetical protein